MMRNNNLLALSALCAAALGLGTLSVAAQDTNAPVAPHPAPMARPTRPPLSGAARSLISLRGAVVYLDRAMMDLQRNDNDFNGHRQAAIDACAKARAELAEIAKEAGLPLPPQRGMPGAMQQRPGVPPPPAKPMPPPSTTQQ